MTINNISMIFAMDRNRLIGNDNKLPWRLPADLAYFKKTTLGHLILMGRKTFESLGKPLPGRKNVILTRDRSYKAPGCELIHSLDELQQYISDQEIFVIGGANIYEQLLPMANRLYITHIDAEFEGDSYFPPLNEEQWQLIHRSEGVVDNANRYPHTFCVYERLK